MKTGLVLVVLLVAVPVILGIGLDPSGFSLVEPDADGWLHPEFSGWAGMSMVTGGGSTTASGTYVGTVSFQLHPRLRAALDLGYSRLYNFHGYSAGRVLGAVDLEWKPSETFTFLLHCSGSLPDSSLTGI
jgi:hypothetical protein